MPPSPTPFKYNWPRDLFMLSSAKHELLLLNLAESENFSANKYDKNSAEGVFAPAGAKVVGATIRTWLLNKFFHS